MLNLFTNTKICSIINITNKGEEKMAMNLISAMKERIKSSGTSKKDVFYVAADSKRRIRFLQELDTG